MLPRKIPLFISQNVPPQVAEPPINKKENLQEVLGPVWLTQYELI